MISQHKRDHAKKHFQASKVLVIIKVQTVPDKEPLKHYIALAYSHPDARPYYKQRCNLIQPLFVLNIMHPDKVVKHRLKNLLFILGEIGRPRSMTVQRDYFIQRV